MPGGPTQSMRPAELDPRGLLYHQQQQQQHHRQLDSGGGVGGSAGGGGPVAVAATTPSSGLHLMQVSDTRSSPSYKSAAVCLSRVELGVHGQRWFKLPCKHTGEGTGNGKGREGRESLLYT